MAIPNIKYRPQVQDKECSIGDDVAYRVAVGLMDLGYAAGVIDHALTAILEARLMNKPVDKKVREDFARMVCELPELAAKVWHNPHEEAEFLYKKLLENQVHGESPDKLCDVALAGIDDDEVFNELIYAIREISDMIMEPCGTAHAEAIVGCIVGGKDCEGLRSWKQTREDVVKSHHKARISSDVLKRILEEKEA